jgi:monofunctional glycosyltransferase
VVFSSVQRSRVQAQSVARRTRITIAVIAATLLAMAAMLFPLQDVKPLVGANPTRTSYMRLRGSPADSTTWRAHWTPLDGMAPLLVCAVVKGEDRFFIRHNGLDPSAIARNVHRAVSGQSYGGASTITQQLARNLYLSPTATPRRKLREVVIALRLERWLTKNRILELYLNTIEWGPSVWGASMATRHYFSASPAVISAFQASFMAAMLPAPTLAPIGKNGERVHRTQRRVLIQLANSGLVSMSDAKTALLATDQWYSAQSRGIPWRTAVASAASVSRTQAGPSSVSRAVLANECGLNEELGAG